MKPFTTLTGTGMPLRRSNIDTDQIIPARYVPYFSWHGHTNALFADWRDDPSFVLNLPQYQGATVLVAGTDFGTGSSRESAVWALQRAGFAAVIAPRFGDIFTGNALMRGVVTATVPEEVVERLWQLIEEDPFTPSASTSSSWKCAARMSPSPSHSTLVPGAACCPAETRWPRLSRTPATSRISSADGVRCSP